MTYGRGFLVRVKADGKQAYLAIARRDVGARTFPTASAPT